LLALQTQVSLGLECAGISIRV